jgi:lysophospholipase L1-like esterase
MKLRHLALGMLPLLIGAAPAPQITPAGPLRDAGSLQRLPVRVVGRAVREGDTYHRQWPGTYLESAFAGPSALFTVGAGDVSLRLSVDGAPLPPLVHPTPQLYRVSGLGAGRHRLRIEVVSESQAGETVLGPVWSDGAARPAPLSAPARQIEFIGDSHTVGYGNTSAKGDCTQAEVWATTDTTQGIPGQLARRYGADREVNAISGRGVVRNYDGFAADTLPQAYPFALLDHRAPAAEQGWHPQLIVMALGTNDFSTALKSGERWADRAALHRDFEDSYAAFIAGLRRRNPNAFILLWATDLAGGEIVQEAGRVANRLRAAGDQRLAFVPITGLAFSGCHGHPSVADDGRVADAVARVVDAHPDIWRNDR